MVKTHKKSELESILNITGCNCVQGSPVKVCKKQLENCITCLQDIVEELNINMETQNLTMSDIEEYETYYKFILTTFSQKHGSYAVHCLEAIPHRNYTVIIFK